MHIGDYFRPLIARWWLILAAVLIASASGVLVTQQQPAAYEAHVTLMVGRALETLNPNSNDLYLTQQLAATYADIANRAVIRSATQSALGLSWLPAYSVRVVQNTQLIELTVMDTDPARAQAVANELGNQLMRLSPSNADPELQQRQQFINQQLDDLEASMRDTRDEIAKKQVELAGMYSARLISETEGQITALQQKLSSLQANYGSLLQGTQRGATNSLNLVEPAQMPGRPVGPNRAATVLYSSAIGFLLAAAGAYGLSYLDTTLKNPGDVHRSLGLDSLGNVPVISGRTDISRLVSEQHPEYLEAYSALRANLDFSTEQERLQLLLITSSAPGEGKSLNAANLGITLALSGQQVILVDADLRRPAQHILFGLPNRAGMTTLLQDPQAELAGLLQPTSVPGLRLLSAGSPQGSPSQLMVPSRLQRVLADLRQEADTVILDSPPVTVFADAAEMAAHADGTLLVVSAGRTRHALAQEALMALKRAKARVVGVLLNRASTRGRPDYAQYYYRENREEPKRGRRRVVSRSGQVSQPEVPEI